MTKTKEETERDGDPQSENAPCHPIPPFVDEPRKHVTKELGEDVAKQQDWASDDADCGSST